MGWRECVGGVREVRGFRERNSWEERTFTLVLSHSDVIRQPFVRGIKGNRGKRKPEGDELHHEHSAEASHAPVAPTRTCSRLLRLVHFVPPCFQRRVRWLHVYLP